MKFIVSKNLLILGFSYGGLSVDYNSSKLEQLENKWQNHQIMINENIFNFNKFHDEFFAQNLSSFNLFWSLEMVHSFSELWDQWQSDRIFAGFLRSVKLPQKPVNIKGVKFVSGPKITWENFRVPFLMQGSFSRFSPLQVCSTFISHVYTCMHVKYTCICILMKYTCYSHWNGLVMLAILKNPLFTLHITL